MGRGAACADEPDRLVSQLDVNHQEDPLSVGHPEEQRALHMDLVFDGGDDREKRGN